MKRALCLALAAGAAACTPAGWTHFDVDRGSQVRAGMSERQVADLIGRPHHMFKNAPNKLGCAYTWKYESTRATWTVPRDDMMLVLFTADGRVREIERLEIDVFMDGTQRVVSDRVVH